MRDFEACLTACGLVPTWQRRHPQTPSGATLPPWCHTGTWNAKLQSVRMADLDAESGWAHWCGSICCWSTVVCGSKVFTLVIVGCVCVVTVCVWVETRPPALYVLSCDLIIETSDPVSVLFFVLLVLTHWSVVLNPHVTDTAGTWNTLGRSSLQGC